jgi:hypothetical protein
MINIVLFGKPGAGKELKPNFLKGNISNPSSKEIF